MVAYPQANGWYPEPDDAWIETGFLRFSGLDIGERRRFSLPIAMETSVPEQEEPDFFVQTYCDQNYRAHCSILKVKLWR